MACTHLANMLGWPIVCAVLAQHVVLCSLIAESRREMDARGGGWREVLLAACVQHVDVNFPTKTWIYFYALALGPLCQLLLLLLTFQELKHSRKSSMENINNPPRESTATTCPTPPSPTQSTACPH